MTTAPVSPHSSRSSVACIRLARGRLYVDGQPTTFNSPREALDNGIATVYQDLATVPLMAVWRNFYLGNEPTKGFWPFRGLRTKYAKGIVQVGVGRDGYRYPGPRPARWHALRW